MRLIAIVLLGLTAACSPISNPYTNRDHTTAPGTAYAAGNEVYH